MAASAKIPLAVQTLFSDLEQRVHDADFSENFERPGTFKKLKRHNRYYWYWQQRKGQKVVQKYVGPFNDKALTDRVRRFEVLKSDYDERRRIVRSLIAAGLPSTEPLSGAVVEAFCRAGFFRLRGVAIGTTAYQCYSGVLGVRLAASTLRTADADFAQFFAIAQMIDDAMPPILEVLRSVDPTFREIPHLADSRRSTKFVNDAAFKVEFLTPNRGRDDYQGKPAPMPALSGASADPLRYLDFLIRHPVRSVLLHEAGIPVTIPAPERYAIHKLIFSHLRADLSKVPKDIAQASALIQAMAPLRAPALADAWVEAWQRGPAWKQNLLVGLEALTGDVRDVLGGAVHRAAGRKKLAFEKIWPTRQFAFPQAS
jgi:hypothetical protein